MLADKSAEAVALALGKVCQRWLCVSSTGSRGQPGELLARRVKSVLPGADISTFEALSEAMQAAVTNAGEDETILVFGSFSTVSGAADWIRYGMQRDGHDAAKMD
jgi:dihydrofolate synthase/folylpolyglutamate synthase